MLLHRILPHNNFKIYKEDTKGEILKEIWEKVFRISPEENQAFNITHENRINNYLTENIGALQPHQQSDLNRLNDEHFLTNKITTMQVKETIKKLKKQLTGNQEDKQVSTTEPTRKCYTNIH